MNKAERNMRRVVSGSEQEPFIAQLYCIEDVANKLCLHVDTVRRYVRQGRLLAVRLGADRKGQLRFRLSDIEAFVVRQETERA